MEPRRQHGDSHPAACGASSPSSSLYPLRRAAFCSQTPPPPPTLPALLLLLLRRRRRRLLLAFPRSRASSCRCLPAEACCSLICSMPQKRYHTACFYNGFYVVIMSQVDASSLNSGFLACVKVDISLSEAGELKKPQVLSSHHQQRLRHSQSFSVGFSRRSYPDP
jgi:uncharacterized protein (TIGR03382 family)